jgi:hypothetical protein
MPWPPITDPIRELKSANIRLSPGVMFIHAPVDHTRPGAGRLVIEAAQVAESR